MAFLSISSERHLQLVDSFLAPLLDVESHLLKEMEHGSVFSQYLCIKTKEPLLLRQKGKVRKQLRSDSFVLIIVPHCKGNLCGMEGLVDSDTVRRLRSLPSPLFE